MSTSKFPDYKPPELDQTRVQDTTSGKDSIPENFLSEVEKVLKARAEHLGGRADNSEGSFTSTDRPPTTSESEGEQKRHSLKTRFLNAIMSGNFRLAYQEISHKVSSRDFADWLHRVLPDVQVTFRTFEGLEYPGKASPIDVVEKGEVFLDKADEGAKILGQLDDLILNEKLYAGKTILISSIDQLVEDLKSDGEGTKDFRNLLKKIKKELLKEPPSPDKIKQIATKYQNVINIVYPAFTGTATADSFKQQFPVLVDRYCEVIQEKLDDVGLFRVPGNIATQSVIVTRFLDGDSSKDTFEDFQDINQYCGGLKVLCDQLMYLKDQGVLSDDDIKELEPSIVKIQELLSKIEGNENNKMTGNNIAIAAGKLTRVLDLVNLNKWAQFKGSVDDGESKLKDAEAQLRAAMESAKKGIKE